MNRTWFSRLACVVALVVAAVLIPYAATSAAQKSGDKSKGPRLPNFYAKVSTETQQTKLRAIVEEYSPQIQAKRDELQALIAKRDAALDEVLTPEQREELAKLRAAAAERRNSDDDAAGEGKGKSKKAKSDKAA